MKYYIDLGANIGTTLDKAIHLWGDEIDLFIGFEPVIKCFNKMSRKYKGLKKVKIISAAVGTITKKSKFYLWKIKKEKKSVLTDGSGLFPRKEGMKSISVKQINFSKYIIKEFNKDDDITLKIDIEGKEYDLLEHMIKTGSISYINKIYCEWHLKRSCGREWNKNKHNEEWRLKQQNRHDKLISDLNKLGFPLRGESCYDEFSKIVEED